MKQKLMIVTTACALGLSFGAEAASESAKAELRNVSGEGVGEVKLADQDGKVEVRIEAKSLPPDFHGFHIHSVGDCSASDFTSAGGHFNPEGEDHPGHAGDMPTLLAMSDGSGFLTFETDRFKVADLLDDDGSAIIIHAKQDNHANIPERYQPPSVDDKTLGTGDAGDHLACGVIKG